MPSPQRRPLPWEAAWRGAAHPATQPAEVLRGNYGGNTPAHVRRLRGRRKPPPGRVICGASGRLRQEGPQARAGEAAPRKAPTGQEWCEAKGLRRTGDRGSRGGTWGATPRSAAIAPWKKLGPWWRRRGAGCRGVRKEPLRAGVAGSGPCRAPVGRRGLRPLRSRPTARAANHTRGGVSTPPRSQRSCSGVIAWKHPRAFAEAARAANRRQRA